MMSRSESTAAGDPLEEWLRSPVLFSDVGGPIDAILFWQQKLDVNSGSKPLAQMALDVLSCPGKLFNCHD